MDEKKNYKIEIYYTDMSGNAIPHGNRFQTREIWKFGEDVAKDIVEKLPEVAKCMGGVNIGATEATIDDAAESGMVNPGVAFQWKYDDRNFCMGMSVCEETYFGSNAECLTVAPDADAIANRLVELLKNQIDNTGAFLTTGEASDPYEGGDAKELMEAASKKIKEIDDINKKKSGTPCFAGNQNPRDLDDEEEYPTIDNIAKNLVAMNEKLDKIIAFIDNIRKGAGLLLVGGEETREAEGVVKFLANLRETNTK